MNPTLFDQSWSRSWQTNRLVAMVKEPDTIFVYWELEDLRKRLISEHFQADWNSLPFFLQVYDVTHLGFNGYNANSTRRIQVHPLSDNWYIHNLEPGRHYQLDFGTTTLSGHFFAILRSNIVETPRFPPQYRMEPSVRFGTLHTRDHFFDTCTSLPNTVTVHKYPESQRANTSVPVPTKRTATPTSVLEVSMSETEKHGEPSNRMTTPEPVPDQPWGDQFDGYTLVGEKGGCC
ncbi:DUF4912 domain-containing protein [Effusibacillus lacus]|uniref:DUF4912 domain-containing protein n=1 Tax=Effusibacillus lacus TaxID=1348429 RepID=UPI0010E075D6|nr:DUF4912 domain-containing protein [Effusibacillus lacus]TCS75458.1 uncharacterized protein DUF4912 [Effusibacillus lacus]